MLRPLGLATLFRALAALVGASTFHVAPALAQDGVPALAITAPNGAKSLLVGARRVPYAKIATLASLGRQFPEDAGLYHRLMAHDRNLAWMPGLRQALNAGGSVVTVGAAHLPGPDGLIALLRADGYRIDETKLPSDTALEVPQL